MVELENLFPGKTKDHGFIWSFIIRQGILSIQMPIESRLISELFPHLMSVMFKSDKNASGDGYFRPGFGIRFGLVCKIRKISRCCPFHQQLFPLHRTSGSDCCLGLRVSNVIRNSFDEGFGFPLLKIEYQ